MAVALPGLCAGLFFIPQTYRLHFCQVAIQSQPG